jgi:hypothetical protein
VLSFFRRIIAHSAENKVVYLSYELHSAAASSAFTFLEMTANALAICTAPNFIRPKEARRRHIIHLPSLLLRLPIGSDFIGH